LIGVTRDGAIGVDLEEVRPVRIAQIRRRDILAAGAALIPSAPITQLSEEAAFMRAWVRLEALAKARGDGLARTLSALGLRTAARSDVSQVAAGVAQHLAATGLRLHDLALAPGRVGAVALDRTLALPPLSPLPSEPGGIEELLRTRAAG
jgi:4'-phosphopantetheinyl transferase